MESTVWKFPMENKMHSLWKVYGNYSMSLLISEQTALCDSSTRGDLNFLCTFKIWCCKVSICIVFFILVL